VERFDDVMMNHVASGTRVHLGPGEFKTTGFSPGPPVLAGWQAKSRINIVGAGIESTILRLELDARHAGRQVFAIGHELTVGTAPNSVDFFELSDLTIDCAAGLPFATGCACCGARVMGHHVRLQRVRVRAWGTRCPVHRAYGIMLVTAITEAGGFESRNAGVADCVVIDPFVFGSDARATAIHVGSPAEAPSAVEATGLAPYVRNCYLACLTPVAELPDEFRGLSVNWCRGAVIEGNQIHNIRIGGPRIEDATVRDLIVRNNYYRHVARGPEIRLGGVAFAPAALASLVRLTDEGGTIAEATTGGPHGLNVGERVRIDASPSTSPEYKGTFAVREIPTDNPPRFRYKMTAQPNQATATNPTWQKLFGSSFILIESNTIELAGGATGQIAIEVSDSLADAVTTLASPDHVHGDVVVRRNKIRYADLQAGLGYQGTGIKAAGVKNLTVSENVLECDPEDPIRDYRCENTTYFNNKTPQGALIRGFDQNANLHASELATDADDALLLGFV
jgi:hypothetical protein